MRQPTKVWYGGLPIRIVWKTPVHDSDGNRVTGTFDSGESTIEVDSKCRQALAGAVLLHELLHALEYWSYQPTGKLLHNEEDRVVSAEKALYPVLRDRRNKPFWDYVMGGNDE